MNNKKKIFLVCCFVLIIITLFSSLFIYKKRLELKKNDDAQKEKINILKEKYSLYAEGKKVNCSEELCDYLNGLVDMHYLIENASVDSLSLNDFLNKDIVLDELNTQKNTFESFEYTDINKYLKSFNNDEKDAFLNIYRNSIVTENIEEDREKIDTYLKEINQNIEIINYLNDNSNKYTIINNKVVYFNNEFRDKFQSYKLNIPIISDEEAFGKRIPILTYHGVDDDIWGNSSLFVKPSEFEKQMKYLNENGFTTLFLSEIGYASNYEKPIILTFDDGYMDMYTIAYPIMKSYGIKSNMYIISGWLDGEVYMNSDMVKDLSNSGLVEIGSHTVSHVHLSTLSYEEQEKELFESKQDLENITGKKINTIAYPYGQRNYETLQIAKKYYDYAVTTDSGANYANTYMSSSLILKRYNMQRGTSFETFKNIVG